MLYGDNFRYGPRMDLGYARVSTAKQDRDYLVNVSSLSPAA